MALTELDRRIGRIAVPAVAALATDPLYDLCDTAILGHLGPDQLAGAAVASSILLSATAVFIFLVFATTASVARLVGAGDERGARAYAVQVMWLGLAIGVVVALTLAPAGGALITAFGAVGATREHAITYFTVSLAGIPAFLATMAGAGVHRGRQNTLRVLWVNGGGVVVNLVLEVALVYGARQGVAASALGTVVAKWLVAAVYWRDVAASARGGGVPLRPDPSAMRRIGVSGGPLLVRTIALRGALTAGVAAAGRVGTVELAGFAIAFQVWSFLAYLADGLETAGQALLGVALGRGRIDEARATGRRLLLWAWWAGLFGAAVVILGRPVLGHAFSSDAAVLDVVAMSLWFVAAAQPVNTMTFTLDGILVGAGDQAFLARAMVGAAVAYLAAVASVRWLDGGLAWLWAAQLAFMGCRGVALALRFRRGRWTRRAGANLSSCQPPTG